MFQFQSEKVTDHVRRIHGYSDEQMYLIEGRDRAALVDTGTGIGNLKTYVEQFTEKEIIVILTHGHLDHALGAKRFDTVYINHQDDEVYERHKQPEFREMYYRIMPGYDALEPGDYEEPMDIRRALDLADGQIFDLGGITLRVLACPGHTPGSMTVLVEEERLLIIGDACNPFTFLFFPEALGLSEYEENLKAYRKRVEGLYDRAVFCHGAVEEPAADIIENVIEACEFVKRGEAVNIPVMFADGTRGYMAKAISEQFADADGKYGNIVYNPDKL